MEKTTIPLMTCKLTIHFRPERTAAPSAAPLPASTDPVPRRRVGEDDICSRRPAPAGPARLRVPAEVRGAGRGRGRLGQGREQDHTDTQGRT